MNTITKLGLALLLTGFLSAELMAQRGGRGQSRQGNRNGQSAQNGAGQNSRVGNTQSQSGRGQNGNGQMGQGQNGRGQGQGGQGQGQGGNGQGQSGGTLTSNERSQLSLMREEEKLARDVYGTLYKKWNANIFANISRAESRHMESIGGLLTRYRIPDPIVNNRAGAFSTPKFQQLFSQLVDSGSNSLVDALKVGLKIEEMDIADLRTAMQATDNNDIKRVYQHLEQGSRNHLRAFAAQLRSAGGTYVATHLNQNEFDQIANSSNDQKGNGQRGGQANGRGNGQMQQGAGGNQNGRGNGNRGGSQGQGKGKGRGQ